MSEFSSNWLDLREPLDHAARSDTILSAVGHYFLNDGPLTIADIGSGTGSTMRALSPTISNLTHWNLIDADAALLEKAAKTKGFGQVTCHVADLSQSLEAVLDTKPNLVTTSAFLDLVSADWLETFIDAIVQHNLPFYAALTFDGRASCNPAHALEPAILDAFNQHQKTDKGFGASLGPDAADVAIDLFQQNGYRVNSETSDWLAASDHWQFQSLLLEGWRDVAIEMEPENTEDYRNWYADRLERIKARNLEVMVGHIDFFAIPQT
ncbi:MAG: class I SAM-dependent methyltransferase [Pseudomonadota bacterium]